MKFWKEVNWSAFFDYNKGYLIVATLLMRIVEVMQGILFYFLHDKKTDLTQPFNIEMKRCVSKM